MTALRVRYQTLEFSTTDIHVRTLRDKQQFSDPDGVAEKLGISDAQWSLFGIVWDAGKVLANLMYTYKVEGKRILEVGCGIALASLVLNHRKADITATDYHPNAESFLERNVELNEGEAIPFVRTGWGEEEEELGLFDLIIGSDLLYEPQHVQMLSIFLNRHAKLHAEVIMVDPGRGNVSRFSKEMVTNGFEYRADAVGEVSYLEKKFKGKIHYFNR